MRWVNSGKHHASRLLGNGRPHYESLVAFSFLLDFVPNWRWAYLPGGFIQDNLSSSSKGVLRGLHYQRPFAQGKLLSVVDGEIFDVAVDIRRSSPTFGKWVGVRLSSENKKQLWVPVAFTPD